MLSFKQWLFEKILVKTKNPPVMILSNPTRKELTDLSDFSRVHELTISTFLDNMSATEWRMIYDLTDKEWFVWSGLQTHNDIIKRFKLPKIGVVRGYVDLEGNEIRVNITGYSTSAKNKKAAVIEVEKLMKSKGIKGYIETT